MFSFLKNKLSSLYTSFTAKINSIFSRTVIDEASLKELEELLLGADTGIHTTRTILQSLRQELKNGTITHGQDLKKALEQKLTSLLAQPEKIASNSVYLLVGINGSGKTTLAGKLAYLYRQQGKKVLLVAGDTFRAAATHQLKQWAEKTGADIVMGKEHQDPASVIFTACQQFKQQQYDVLIIDTAGRLQTKTHLMKELEKIVRILHQQLPQQSFSTLLTVDAMLGQNSFEQAKLFHESTKVDGIVLTKLDGSGKGGIVFAINQELHIPILYISHGEQADQLASFHAHEYVQQLLS